jgi:squalene synthase HpnC
MRYGSERLAVSQVATGRAVVAEGAENFTVASRLLPRLIRRDLRVVYDVARAIDNLGDDAPGDRRDLLDGYAADLRLVWGSGEPSRPELRRLVPTVREHALSSEPFFNLVAANLLDQSRSSYPSWPQLREYCALSADPVGRIVLEIFAASTPERVALSDDVCTALQVLEHCQDVAEDRRRGRIYLPEDERARYGVSEADLEESVTSEALRAAVAHEVARALTLLGSGPPLVRSLHGVGRWAVAGYIAGGLATADALRRSGFDVMSPDVSLSPRRRDTVRHLLGVVVGR